MASSHFSTCPKCGREFNPRGVSKAEQDPRGWCWWCAHGITLFKEKRKGRKGDRGSK